MNPLFIKLCAGVGVGVLFSAAALLILLLRSNERPHCSHGFSGSYTNDGFRTPCVCCICLEDIDNTTDENKVFILPCRHKFHKQCLKMLFAEQSFQRRCPYCRRHIPDNVVSQCQ